MGYKSHTNVVLEVEIMYHYLTFEANNNVGIFEPTNTTIKLFRFITVLHMGLTIFYTIFLVILD